MKTIQKDGKRYYVTPRNHHYPSVTTVLGMEKAEVLEEWRKRVGDEEADRIMKRAAERGTNVHELLERHLAGEKINLATTMPFLAAMFKPIRDYLDKYLKETIHSEIALYSDQLKVAGRIDLIGRFDEIEVVDFKTARKEKKEDQIDSYRMQVAAYAWMYRERHGITINRYRILMVDEYGTFQVFQGKTAAHIKDFAEARVRFFQATGT